MSAIYQIITEGGTSSNNKLTYNFDNVTTNSDNTLHVFDNVKILFPSYNPTIHKSFSTYTQNINGSTPSQITYYDNVTKSNINYTIRYIHVCPIPVATILPTTWDKSLSIILNCKSTDNTQSILLLIIPLKATTDLTELNIDNLLSNVQVDTQNNPVDINKLIPLSQFNTYSVGSNKFIFMNSINYKSSSITIFSMDTLFTSFTTGVDNPIDTTFYTSTSIPSKQTLVVPNDIYIDCYKVSDNKGTFVDPIPKIKNSSSLDKKKSKILWIMVDVFLAILIFIFLVRTFYYYKYISGETLFVHLKNFRDYYYRYIISFCVIYLIVFLVILFKL